MAAVRTKKIVSDTCIETEVVLIASCQIWVMALMARDWAASLRALRRVGELSAAEPTVQLRRAHFALVGLRDERRGAFRGKSSHCK